MSNKHSGLRYNPELHQEVVDVSADVKSEALDRVLEALSPALGVELDRLVHETRDATREALERDFQARLEAVSRDGERAVEQAREEARAQITAEMEQQLKERLDAAAAEFRTESADERMKLDAMTDQLKHEWSVERSQLQGEVARWRAFAEAQQQLAEASSQSEMLTRALILAQPFAAGAALYVAKADGLALWRSKGDGAFPENISPQKTEPDSYFRAISIRGKTVAALCAAPPFKVDALDFLAAALERAVEVFGLKLRTPVPKASS